MFTLRAIVAIVSMLPDFSAAKIAVSSVIVKGHLGCVGAGWFQATKQPEEDTINLRELAQSCALISE
jgi:hypothetical protein